MSKARKTRRPKHEKRHNQCQGCGKSEVKLYAYQGKAYCEECVELADELTENNSDFDL